MKTGKILKITGLCLILIGLLVTAGVWIYHSEKSRDTVVFSPKMMLEDVWHSYKKEYIDPQTGRTIDKQKNVTTSEGESYTMLRAVWLSDKETFDQSWGWTKANLEHKNNHLFSWLYGQLPSGEYGVLISQGGQNSASDADTDIALSLVFAYFKWHDKSYLEDAYNTINDIWNQEVVAINGKNYLASNDIEKNVSEASPSWVVVNPSYFAPYAYKIFSVVDRSHDWNKLVNDSYSLLSDSMSSPIDSRKTAGLPPDWILLDRSTGIIRPDLTGTLTSNYGFDAMRVPWRIALDWQWFRDSRAEQTLEEMAFLKAKWQAGQSLYTAYRHDGRPDLIFESPAMYGTSIGYFLVSDPSLASKIYGKKLSYLYDPDLNGWRQSLSYYDDNWAWFGIALYNNMLTNMVPASVLKEGGYELTSTAN